MPAIANHVQVFRDVRSWFFDLILSAYSPLMDEALGVADLWLTKASADGSQLPRVLSELSTIQ